MIATYHLTDRKYEKELFETKKSNSEVWAEKKVNENSVHNKSQGWKEKQY